MKRNNLILILYCFLILIACNSKGNKLTINYRGIMTKNDTVLNIEFFIEDISNHSAVIGNYLLANDEQPIEIFGGINNTVLTLSEKNTEKLGTFVFNNFDVEKNEIIGIWINSNDNTDIYNVKLTKFIPNDFKDIQENNISVSVNDLRKYIGYINQGYHNDLVEFINFLKKDLNSDDKLSKQLDNYLEGGFGTGFVYVDTDGKNYIITNHHVVSQSFTPSITFENQDGTKIKYSDLQIVMIDDDLDLALLAFPNDQKPFSNGIQIHDASLDDGYEIFTAGYPGFGHRPLWQFGRGIVSNSSAYLPKKDDWENTKGPYIQHTAEVDPGNSGGPLLVDINQSREYVVAGVNTLKASKRQAANYSIPANQLSDFITRALGKTEINEQEKLKERINSFIDILDEEDYEYVLNYFSDTFANRLIRAVINKNNNDPIIKIFDMEEQGLTMSLLNSMATLTDPLNGTKLTLLFSFLYGSTGNIDIKDTTINIKTIDGNGIGFTAHLDINGEPVTTEWIKEYGVWRMNNFKIIERDNNVMKRAKMINIGTSVSDKSDFKSKKWYKVDITSGCWLNVYTEGNMDTQLSLYNSEGILIAKDDDSGSGYNANILIGLTEGTVFIEVSGYSKTNDDFLLTTKTVNGNFQNRYREQAVYIAAGIILTSSFQYNSDVNWYKLEIPSNARGLTVYSEGRMDTKISVYNSQGRLLAEDDDSGNGYNAQLNVSVQGMIYVKIEELDRRIGEFRLITQIIK